MLILYQKHDYKNSVELSFIISQSHIWIWILKNVFWFQYILRNELSICSFPLLPYGWYLV